MKALDRTLEAWADEYRASLDPSVRKLISQANFDLYYGPVADGAVGDPATDDPDEWSGYPGFVSATKRIAEALDDVPGRLFVDVGAECWSDREPTAERCEACEGEGYSYEPPSDDESPCPECRGTGQIEPFTEETYQVDRSDLLRALVGRELVGYVS